MQIMIEIEQLIEEICNREGITADQLLALFLLPFIQERYKTKVDPNFFKENFLLPKNIKN